MKVREQGCIVCVAVTIVVRINSDGRACWERGPPRCIGRTRGGLVARFVSLSLECLSIMHESAKGLEDYHYIKVQRPVFNVI